MKTILLLLTLALPGLAQAGLFPKSWYQVNGAYTRFSGGLSIADDGALINYPTYTDPTTGTVHSSSGASVPGMGYNGTFEFGYKNRLGFINGLRLGMGPNRRYSGIQYKETYTSLPERSLTYRVEFLPLDAMLCWGFYRVIGDRWLVGFQENFGGSVIFFGQTLVNGAGDRRGSGLAWESEIRVTRFFDSGWGLGLAFGHYQSHLSNHGFLQADPTPLETTAFQFKLELTAMAQMRPARQAQFYKDLHSAKQKPAKVKFKGQGRSGPRR